MNKLDTKLQLIQTEIDNLGSGHCLFIKLKNYDELYTIIDDSTEILSDLNKIIHDVCNLYTLKPFTIIEQSSIFCILHTLDEALLNTIAFTIYYNSQLYNNTKMPCAYMNCCIKAMNFVKNDNAKKIYIGLYSLLTHFNNDKYYQKYDDALHNIAQIKQDIKSLNMLRNSLKQKTMRFAYQPIINSKTSKPHYYECLLRIPNEDNDLVSVGPIIQYAESTGLIHIVDLIVFEMAINELINSPDITLSINISSLGIVDTKLLELIQTLLSKHAVASRLIIEITETAFNNDYHRTKFVLNHLRKFGCRFALDDFGAGFTSFQQLQNFPIDIIKIDGSYIRNIHKNRFNRYLVEHLVKLSEDLGIKTVAEFVENGEIAKYLIDINVDGLQGNFFSPATSTRKQNLD